MTKFLIGECLPAIRQTQQKCVCASARLNLLGPVMKIPSADLINLPMTINSISWQAYHVTDAALGYFSPKQSHNLSILRLQSCWELTNHGIVNIGE